MVKPQKLSQKNGGLNSAFTNNICVVSRSSSPRTPVIEAPTFCLARGLCGSHEVLHTKCLACSECSVNVNSSCYCALSHFPPPPCLPACSSPTFGMERVSSFVTGIVLFLCVPRSWFWHLHVSVAGMGEGTHPHSPLASEMHLHEALLSWSLRWKSVLL